MNKITDDQMRSIGEDGGVNGVAENVADIDWSSPAVNAKCMLWLLRISFTEVGEDAEERPPVKLVSHI